MNMVESLYQEYLFVIGKIKDTFDLTIDVEHRNIHTFYQGKRPLFKLFYGTFSKETDPTIAISFHLDLFHPEAIQWFVSIYNIHPLLRLQDSYLEDDRGETYIGEDALALQNIYTQQEVLNEWLSKHTQEEIKDFAEAEVKGRERDPKKSFNSQVESEKANIEFERLRLPDDDEEVH